MKNTLIIGLIFLQYQSYSQTNIDSCILQYQNKNLSLFDYRDIFFCYCEKNDTDNASKTILKLDPFYFLAFGITPDRFNQFFENLPVNLPAQTKYVDSLNFCYNMAHSIEYENFSVMLKEDQRLRNIYDNCVSGCDEIQKELKNSDSTHFSYLYNYVLKHGWPSILNGSLMAQIIALHDHNHINFYLPILKNAVKNNIVDIRTMHLMETWQGAKERPEILKSKSLISFDVTILFNNRIDNKTLNSIRKAISDHCPIKYVYLCYQGGDKQKYLKWSKEIINSDSKNSSENYVSDFTKEIQNDSCNNVILNGFFEYSELRHPKLKIYLAY